MLLAVHRMYEEYVLVLVIEAAMRAEEPVDREGVAEEEGVNEGG